MKQRSKWLFNLEDQRQFDQLVSLKGSKPDVILGSTLTARTFSWSWQECLRLAAKLKERGFAVFLQWDVLMTEHRFAHITSQLKDSDLSLFDAVRVQDPGALLWLQEHQTSCALHFIAETGNHNALGLSRWLSLAGPQLERMVLSPELDATTVLSMVKALAIDCEIQALGRLLLFYTPRQLLSPLTDDHGDDTRWREARGTSEESPHKGFPLLENSHGTFMFNTKDLFILDERDHMAQVHECSRLFLRCDHSPLALDELAAYFDRPSLAAASQLRERYDKMVIKGFFRTNKTDVLFSKLKNSRLQQRSDKLIGEVVEVKKKQHVAIHLKEHKTFRVGDSLRFISPEGLRKEVRVASIKNASGATLEHPRSGQVVYIPPVGGVSVRTQVEFV